MDLTKLAVSLGLPKESSEGAVFEALAKRDAESRKAVESLAKLTGQLGEHGFSLATDGKLVRVEPLKLDIKPEDDEEKRALKAQLAADQAGRNLDAAKSNKDFVTKLAKDLGLPPALMSLTEEILAVRGEMEAIHLSKDGKAVELKRTADFPKKAREWIEKLATLKTLAGSRFTTPTPDTDEELAKKEREKVATDLAKKHQGGQKEELATK